MNLFETDDNTQQAIHIQRWSTRIYLTILIIIMGILLMQTGLQTQTVMNEVKNPTMDSYLKLLEHYSDVRCPCSQVSISFGSFVAIVPVYHPICFSQFISQAWIDALVDEMTTFRYPGDFRATAGTQFQVLRAFCDFSRRLLENKIELFSNRQFISQTLLSEARWNIEIDAAVSSFLQHTVTSGRHRILFLRSFINFNLLGSSIQTPTALSLETFNNELIVRSRRTLFPAMFNQYYCTCDDGDICYALSGFYGIDRIDNQGFIVDQALQISPSSSLKNWFVGCWAMQSLLRSSFNDSFLSDQDELDQVFSYLNWTSETTRPSSIILNTSSDSTKTSNTVDHLLQNLFAQDIKTERYYSQYFEQCRPKSCFFTRELRSSVLYIIIALISLYGGLSVLLRVLIPHSVAMIIKRFVIRNQIPRTQSKFATCLAFLIANIIIATNSHFVIEDKNTINVPRKNPKIVILGLLRLLAELNLFKSPNRQDASEIQQQYWTTRLYILFMTIGLMILTFYTMLNVQTKIITVKNPTFVTVLDLQSHALINSSLKCPCNEISIPHRYIAQIEPIFHQVCSSNFVSYSKWLYFIRALFSVNNDILPHDLDFRRSYQSFHLLSALCELINQTFVNSLEDFKQIQLVTSSLLSIQLFENQMNSSIKTFEFEFMQIFFSFLRLTRNVTHINQYLNDGNMGSFRVTNTRTATFSIDGYSGVRNGVSYSCSCTNDIKCKSQLGLYDRVYLNSPYKTVPGLYRACFALESLLQSTLECFYDDTMCFYDITGFYQQDWFPTNITLLDSSLPTRFMKNSTVGTMLDELLVEDWKQSLNYSSYFDQCQPSSCSYELIRRNTFLESITIILGLFGGLSVSLRIFIPLMTEIYSLIFRKASTASVLSGNQTLRIKIWNSVTELRYRLKRINVFESDTKKSLRNIEEQQRATLVYYLFFSITLYFLIMYNALIPIRDSFTVMNPTIEQYDQLQFVYGIENVNCPCSQVSLTPSFFIDYRCSFHPICSSEFLSNTFLERLFDIYQQLNQQEATENAFTLKGTIFAHFQALQALCNLTRDAVHNAREQFLASAMVFAFMINRHVFQNQINKSLAQFEGLMIDEFLTNLQFIRGIMQGNALVSLYSSNYYPVFNTWRNYATVYMIPQNYGQCNCLGSAFCKQSSIPYVPGYFVGCTPLEGILQSTLECFYEQNCVNYLATTLNLSLPVPEHLRVSEVQSKLTETIGEITEKMFVDKCSSNFSFDNFFDQCKPMSCTIVRKRKNNAITVVSTIIALYGGLTTSFKLIIPLFMFFIYKIIRKRQRTTTIHVQASSLEPQLA